MEGSKVGQKLEVGRLLSSLILRHLGDGALEKYPHVLAQQ